MSRNKELLESINNKQAVEFLEKKSNRPTPLKSREIANAWTEEARNQAFFSSRVMKADILAEMRKRVEQVMHGKGTTADARHWIKEFLKTDGDQSLFDCGFLSVNASESIAELGSTRRINLIIEQNVRMAQEVGHYQECKEDSDIFPYVKYHSESDSRTRPSHRALNNKVFRMDDPQTAQIWPPNGFGCRCHMEQLDDTDIEDQKIQSGIPEEYFKAKENESDTFTFNPVRASEAMPPRDKWPQNLKDKYTEDIKQLPPPTKKQHGPTGTPVSNAITVRTSKKSNTAVVERALNAIDSVHGDGKLPPIPVHFRKLKAGVNGQFAYKLQSGSPSHINLSTLNKRNELTALHEIGHFLDHSGLPGQGIFSSESGNRMMAEWLKAVEKSTSYKKLLDLKSSDDKSIDRRYVNYLLGRDELFARSYAQYIATRSEDKIILKQLRYNLDSFVGKKYYTQWDEDDFTPIAESFDTLFKKMGWIK